MSPRFVSVTIRRPWRDVYAAFHAPPAFARWAEGLSSAGLREVDGMWHATGPGGPVTIRFSPPNDHGVMDHWVTLGDGSVVAVPMRVVANGDNAEVTLTLFRQPGMTDADFDADAATMAADLARLKALAEA